MFMLEQAQPINVSIAKKKVFGSAAPHYKRLEDHRKCRGVTQSAVQLLIMFRLGCQKKMCEVLLHMAIIYLMQGFVELATTTATRTHFKEKIKKIANMATSQELSGKISQTHSSIKLHTFLRCLLQKYALSRGLKGLKQRVSYTPLSRCGSISTPDRVFSGRERASEVQKEKEKVLLLLGPHLRWGEVESS